MPYFTSTIKNSSLATAIIALTLFALPRFSNPVLADSSCTNNNCQYNYYGIFNGPDYIVPVNGMTNTGNFAGSVNTPYGGNNNSNPATIYNTPVNSESFTLSSDKTQYCLGETPTYSIRASLAWSSKSINWTSNHNGQVTNNTFVIDFYGGWTQSGNTWQTGDEGNWQKTATINGQTQSITIVVQNCGNYTSSQPSYYGGFNGPDTVFNTNGNNSTGSIVNPPSNSQTSPGTTDNSFTGVAERPGVSVGTGTSCVVTPKHECLY